jgi:Fe-S oxidoreductase
MAGSFGYQQGHEDLSRALAERSLLPALRSAPQALVLADGFSCRLQIAQMTGRRTSHLAEVLDADPPEKTAGEAPNGSVWRSPGEGNTA